MKKFFFIIIIILPSILTAQVVVTTPQFPTENDSIIVTLDATQPGAEELLNYTGTVYAHTGVNTNLGDWQHVIGNWGVNTTQPALTRLGPNSYRLAIGYPRQFYGVTNPSEQIQALAMVFRSADASKQTRPDIFINLFEPGITVVINSPNISLQFGDPLRSPAFASQDDTVNVQLTAAEIGTVVSSFTLFLDGTQVAQTNTNQLSYDFIASLHSEGMNEFVAVAVDTAGLADITEFIIFVNPPVVDASLPAGTEHGINYESNTSVTLALFAPYKEFVYLIGDFNDWKVDTDFYMKRDVIDADNVVWWITLDNLTAGQEYAFQYLVDGELRIADPYTEKVLDPWNDQYITNVTYPNLKPYPQDKTAEPVAVFQTDQVPYSWNITDFQRPAKTDLVIYELLIRDFLAAHDYKTLIDTLSYLKNLGVNAIELMPVMEFEGNESWGYNPSFLFAVDKYYGPKNELKRFVDSAHANGIAVILDIVLNHVYGQSPLVRLYWNSETSRPAANNPWFNEVSPNPVYSWGYDFNHESQATKNYVDKVNRFWLDEYNIDGFRFDFTKGFTNTPGDGSAFDPARINILKRMADSIWAFDSTAFVILEHFAINQEESILGDYGMLLWYNMNHAYNEATMGYTSNLSAISYKFHGWTSPHHIYYMESHDEERLMYKNLQFGNSNTSTGYNIKNLNTALNRIKLAAAFFFTVPGPKMIWQFGELGYDVSIDFPCRVCNKPIRWNYFNEIPRLNLYKTFMYLIKLKKEYDVFRSDDFTVALTTYSKRININHPSMNVTIIGNFGISAADNNPNFQNTGWWYDYFSGDSINVTNTTESINLQPGEFRIYTTVKLPTPEPYIVNDLEQTNEDLVVTDFLLEQNYPNPFNPSTKIKFHIADRGFVSIKIYDVLGREIKTLVNEELENGIYNVTWNGDNEFGGNVSSGIYFCRIEAGSYINSKKMILLK